MNAIKRVPVVYDWFFWDAPRPPKPPSAPRPPLFPYTDADGYAVLSAWKHYRAQKNVIFVRREIKPDLQLRNVPSAWCLSLQHRVPFEDAMKDFASKWSQDWTLEDRFIPAQEFLIVPESQLRRYDTRENVPANAAGYFAFSAVGFSNDRKRAVIYVMHRDGHYGDGNFFLMRKNERNEWVVAPEHGCPMWIT